MVILGISDGIAASAALVIDDEVVGVEVQERHDRVARSRAFPWAAIEAVLDEAGLRSRHVDEIAVAGRFTPPLFVRQHPGLRRVARDPFSPAIDAAIFFQAMLRQTGYGAVEADRAGEWIEGQLRANGFAPQRVVLVDIHRALAEAAYRTQPRDELLILTLHPMGDGSAFAVHRGSGGQVDRVFDQKGFEALHVHLQRCAAAMGFEPALELHQVWALGARAEPDAGLLDLLQGELSADEGRMSRGSYPIPESRHAAVYRALANAERAVAAASVLANLVEVVKEMVAWHVRSSGLGHVAVGGAIFDNPRLCAAIAELDEVESLWVHPTPGYESLAIGVAASVGGLAPRSISGPGLGRQYHEKQCARALGVAGLQAVKPTDDAEAVAAFLAEGRAVARFQGRGGWGRSGGGTRSVLVRADDAAAIERTRAALERPADEEPGCYWLGDLRVRAGAKVDEALHFGTIAPEVDHDFAVSTPGVVTPDGRVVLHQVDDGDPAMVRILTALHRRTGHGAVVAFPFSTGSDPPITVPGDAIRVWRRSGIAALLLGPFLVQSDPLNPRRLVDAP